MSATAQNLETGAMVRERAIHGSAKMRDAWHMEHERRMEQVERDAEMYVAALVEWIAVLKKQAVLSIVGWYAHEHGLSFWEALHQLFSRGDARWVWVCQQFGKVKAYGEED